MSRKTCPPVSKHRQAYTRFENVHREISKELCWKPALSLLIQTFCFCLNRFLHPPLKQMTSKRQQWWRHKVTVVPPRSFCSLSYKFSAGRHCASKLCVAWFSVVLKTDRILINHEKKRDFKAQPAMFLTGSTWVTLWTFTSLAVHLEHWTAKNVFFEHRYHEQSWRDADEPAWWWLVALWLSGVPNNLC